MAAQYHPIFVTGFDNKRSQRDAELERSRTRSYAAKLGHQRRRMVQSSAPFYTHSMFYHECSDQCRSAIYSKPKVAQFWQARSLTRRDPFASYAGHNVSNVCHEAIDFALEKAWTPIFAPIRPKEIRSLKVAWKQASVHFPFLFHAEAAAAAGCAFQNVSDKDTKAAKLLRQTQLEQCQLALRHISDEIKRPDFQPSDEYIHAISHLACQSGTLHESDEPYPLSPLAPYQNIYFFGKFDVTYPHVEAMYDIIDQQGGLTSIKQYALADILEVVDIFIATRSGKTPRFPLRRKPFQEPISELINSSKREQIAGQGLESIREISKDLHQPLTFAVEVTELLNQCYHDPGRETPAHKKAITLSRNEIQHALLAYSTSQYNVKAFEKGPRESDTSHDDLALAELVRLAASIYSGMVLFLVPWRTGVKPRLAERMRLVWESSHMSPSAGNLQHSYTRLLVWLLWFGCFGAIRSRHRKWFEHELKCALEAVYGPEWEEMTFDTVKQALRGFLWWDPVCDLAGRDLWNRIRSPAKVEVHEHWILVKPVMSIPAK